MRNIYNPLDISIIRLDGYDCICASTSTSDFYDYDNNELPLVPFEG